MTGSILIQLLNMFFVYKTWLHTEHHTDGKGTFYNRKAPKTQNIEDNNSHSSFKVADVILIRCTQSDIVL